MIKNKVNFKLINMTLIVLIITLLYLCGGLWSTIISKILEILFPFLVAFVVAYALHPYVEKLVKLKVPEKLSMVIVIVVVIGIFIIVGTLAIPLLVEQLGSLFNGIITFIKEISIKYDLDFGPLQKTLSDTFNDIIKNLGTWVSNGALSVISTSVSYVTTFIITAAAAIYFLVDMKKIKKISKSYFKSKGDKTFNYVKSIDDSMEDYLEGFMKIMLISLIEYTVAFFIIGHPNALLLGFIAALGNLVPYFGGLFTNIIALITAFVVSPALFIKALIVFAVLSIVDSYVINPAVYGKSNNLPPILIIFSIFAGGILFGIVGIIISLPVTIIILTTYKYFRKDIEGKIGDLKEKE